LGRNNIQVRVSAILAEMGTRQEEPQPLWERRGERKKNPTTFAEK
jgi:hypothetical protein